MSSPAQNSGTGAIFSADRPQDFFVRQEQSMARASHSPTETVSDEVRALQIIESMPGFAWSADAAGRFTYVSPSTLAFLGGPSEELNAPDEEDEFGWRRVIHPDDYDRVAARWRHCLKTGDCYDTEHRLRRADGIYRWFRNSGRAARDSHGCITQWYGTTIDIEDQKRAEAAVSDRERELTQLVDIVPSHVWRLTPEGEPTFFNKRMVDYLGLDVADTDKPGMSRLEAVIETVHPDDAARFRDTIQSCLVTGESFALRYRLRRADGVFHWMSSRAEPLRDQDGRIVQWYGLCHDIDDQMRADQALRQSEQQLRQMIDAVPVRIWSATPTGEVVHFNKPYQDHFRSVIANFEEFGEPNIEKLLQELIHPEDAPEVQRTLWNCFRTGDGCVMRFRWREKDNAYRWAECRVAPRRDHDGAIVQWYGVSIDVDDMVIAQEALRDRERELSQLVDMVPVHIRRMSPEGEPTFFNKRLIDFFGLDLADLGKPGMSRLSTAIQTLVHPDDSASLLATVRRAIATSEPFTMKYRMRRADGVYRWVDGRGEPVRDQSGAIVHWYVISLDIDDEMRAQEELRYARESLERASQAASLAELSASIAHEVNQPLAAIVTNSNACQRWLTSIPPNLERAQKTVERIIHNANAAADVVSHIRALFKHSVEARASTALSRVIAEAQNLMAEEAARRRVRVNVEVESNLPPVALDRVQVQQVLVNLIRNGMDAMEFDQNDRVIGIRAHWVGNEIRTEISDRGRGVEIPERIFEPFFTTKEHGMGMGLAICRSIVESHGGRLWAENNESQGATFTFTLPIDVKMAS
ncbi:PAS domain-containing protein [Microvirga sp. 3-52]|nr:PAS domain-containing protein [Microvirga sp. 3-52]